MRRRWEGVDLPIVGSKPADAGTTDTHALEEQRESLLRRHLDSLTSRMAIVAEQLQRERGNPRPDPTEIEDLEAESEEIQKQIVDTKGKLGESPGPRPVLMKDDDPTPKQPAPERTREETLADLERVIKECQRIIEEETAIIAKRNERIVELENSSNSPEERYRTAMDILEAHMDIAEREGDRWRIKMLEEQIRQIKRKFNKD